MQRIRPETSEGYRYESKPVAFESPCCYQQGDTRSKVPTIYIPQSKSHLLEVFEFSDEVKECEAYKYWEARKGTYDVAHLRRGDIAVPRPIVAGVNNYSVISMESYYRAFEKFGFDKNAMEWISDDNTNTWHKDRPVAPTLGWEYPVGSNYEPEVIFDWLEDFLKLYFARAVFRANSSFSWWACFLSPYATTYSPYLDKKIPYGETMQETDFEFVPGNETHWYYKGDEFEPWRISISD
jgi:hypothetical protein